VTLPYTVKVRWVTSFLNVKFLKFLLKEEFIGISAEWNAQGRISLFQICGQKTVYIIDLKKVAKNSKMNELLTQIFANPKSIIIAFDLESYRTKFNEQYPNLTFINQAEKFIDVREYYSKVYDDKDNLQAIVRNLFEKAICKAESNCNWNKRPLKKT